MIRPFIALGFLLFSFPSLCAQTVVRTIEFTGVESMSRQDILKVMQLQTGRSFNPALLSSDLNKIIGLYSDDGYFNTRAKIDTVEYVSDSSAVVIQINVNEGRQAVIGEIQLEGNTLFAADEILRSFDSKLGAVFLPREIEKDIEFLLDRYERNGYPFAAVLIGSVEIDPDSESVRLTLHITEGELVTIIEVMVEGNKETKAEVVVRETRIRSGQPFNADLLKAIPKRLNRLNIFAGVSEPELYMTSRGGGLLIRVEEGPTNTFDGVAGYVPPAGIERGYFTGLVDVGMRNLFGTGRKLNVRWHREDRQSQEMFLRYMEPWILGQPVNVAGSFFQRQQDTIYIRRAIEFRADLMLTQSLTIGALYGHEVIIPSTTLATMAVLNSSTITTGVEARYDSRDDLFNPTEGVFYRSDYRIGRKKIFGLADTLSADRSFTVQKLGVDLEWFMTTFRGQVLALGLHGRELQSGRIETGDLYRFGGSTTMRGYRENQFIGSRIVWSNAEYRLILARRSFAFGFFDTGYYFRPADVPRHISETQGMKYGYGVGIRVETGLGNIGVSFALGEGDSFNQGKIHFGLINDF